MKNSLYLAGLRRKETFASTIFGKICFVACTINQSGKLICLHACLPESNRAGLTDKPGIMQLSKSPISPYVELDMFDGNTIEYHYLVTLFHELVEKRIKYQSGTHLLDQVHQWWSKQNDQALCSTTCSCWVCWLW